MNAAVLLETHINIGLNLHLCHGLVYLKKMKKKLPTSMVLVLLSLCSVVLDGQEGCCQNQVLALD